MNISETQFQLLEQKADILKIMGHALRLSIIGLLAENEKLSVTEIFTELGIEQAVASHHLRLLKSAGIVSLTKSGKHSHYYIKDKKYSSIFSLLIKDWEN